MDNSASSGVANDVEISASSCEANDIEVSARSWEANSYDGHHDENNAASQQLYEF